MKTENAREKWRQLIKEFDNSGKSNQSKNKWCKERKISFTAFSYWYSRYGADTTSKYKVIETVESPPKTNKKEPLATTNWLEIKIPESEVHKEIQESAPIKVKIGKAEISVSLGFDKSVFKDVVKVLGELC